MTRNLICWIFSLANWYCFLASLCFSSASFSFALAAASLFFPTSVSAAWWRSRCRTSCSSSLAFFSAVCCTAVSCGSIEAISFRCARTFDSTSAFNRMYWASWSGWSIMAGDGENVAEADCPLLADSLSAVPSTSLSSAASAVWGSSPRLMCRFCFSSSLRLRSICCPVSFSFAISSFNLRTRSTHCCSRSAARRLVVSFFSWSASAVAFSRPSARSSCSSWITLRWWARSVFLASSYCFDSSFRLFSSSWTRCSAAIWSALHCDIAFSMWKSKKRVDFDCSSF